LRLALGGDDELYVITKTDGMIRKLTTALSPPLLQVNASNDFVNLSWTSVPGRTYRLQYKSGLTNASWTDVDGDVIATGISSSKADAQGGAGFYRVVESPTP
jgi:hypothetical protein